MKKSEYLYLDHAATTPMREIAIKAFIDAEHEGFANSSAFAMGKFALRGLAQSLARELHPKGIHIAHFVIDGVIGKEPKGKYQTMNPDQIAKTYLQFHHQDKSIWSWEVELRTSVENF